MNNPTVVFTGPRQVEIEDRDMPQIKDGEVLIATEVTLVSTGTELTVLSCDKGYGERWTRGCHYPFFPGYSNVGKVMEVGAGVDRALIGARVESYGRHARYVAEPAERARPVRPDVASEHAVFATMAEIAFHGVRRSGVGMGRSVVVYGLGLLGQISVRFARLWGARPVLAVDVGESRLDLLPRHPAVVPVNPQRDNVKEKVREATRGRMADIVIEVTGMQTLIPEQIRLLHEEGTLGIVSGPRGMTEMDFHDLCNIPSVRIIGVHNGSHPKHATASDPWTKNRDVEMFLDLVADGDLDMAPLVTHKKPYTEAPEMYRMLLEDRTQAVGVLFDWRDKTSGQSQ
jgi:2-desacetyl-2-hydroxyethyl bacteriochlorophyllide A dehydrogenase